MIKKILFIVIAMSVQVLYANGLECYCVQSISSSIRTPFEKPSDGVLSDRIDVIATPGEYEPASIVLFSKETLSNVMLTSGKLVGIASSIDGSRYIDMSQVHPKNQPGSRNSQFPVKDSVELKPFTLPAGQYKQIWFTFYVPRDTPAGLYKGFIKVTSSDKLLKKLKVNLRVLPFELADSRTYYDPDKSFISSIYYKAILCTEQNQRKPGLTGWWESEQQFRVDLKNMLDHGVNNPHICQLEVDQNPETLEKILKIRQEIGIDNSTLYLHKENNWGVGTDTDPKILQKAINEIKSTKKLVEKFGTKQIYIYAIDEAKGEKLTQQKKVWDAFHKEAGVKVYVAGFMKSPPTPFELCGDKLDLLINACEPKRLYAEQWHGAGHDIWCYGNPQGGVENPLAYRRNFGLVLWKANFDGASTFVYNQGYGHSWNDFDDKRYRDHNLVYPTINGVIDTIAWEGYREAMDDIRYGTVLKKLISRITSDPNKESTKLSLAKEADEWLEALDENSRNLDTVRMEMIGYILRLMR